MTKSQTSFQAFGYHLNAIKPVHLANGFFLALTGKHYRLEWLNKLAVVTHKKGLHGDYETPNLREILANEKRVVRSSMTKEELSQLRFQANAIVANDDAVYAAFDDYSAFGNDYTLSSPKFLCNLKRKDGYAGYFIYSVLAATEVGQEIISIAKDEFEREGDSLARLFKPILDKPESQTEWDNNQFDEKLGELTSERLNEIAALMSPTTEGILRLLRTSRVVESRYSFLRQLIIALGTWLLLYLIRESSVAAGIDGPPLLFCDLTENASKKSRAKSMHCFSRYREMIYRSFFTWLDTGKISTLEPYVLKKGRREGQIELKDVERHFQDLAIRVGIAQPRAGSNPKHFEPQADTVRTLVMSLLNPEEGPITFQELAARLRSTWGVVFGGCDDDVTVLADQGIIGLDEDDDLSLNRRSFIERLKALGLASEPSDGLVLCEVNAEVD